MTLNTLLLSLWSDQSSNNQDVSEVQTLNHRVLQKYSINGLGLEAIFTVSPALCSC